MKKFFSILCAMAIVLSASATPQVSKKDLDAKASQKELRVKTPFQTMEKAPVKAADVKALNMLAKAPKAKKDVTFNIAISDITTSSATVAVTPSDNAATYYWTYFEASEIAGLTDAEIGASLKGDMDYTIMLYEYFYGMTLTYADLAYQGPESYTFSSLNSNTAYVIVAMEIDANGNGIGAAAQESFTTLEVILPTGGTFVAVEVTEKFYATDNDVWVRMTDADGNAFNFDIVVPDGLNALESGVTYTLADMLADYSYAKVLGETIDYASASLTKTVAANGDYTIAASFVDTLGNTWNINYTYVKPIANRQESLTLAGLELNLFEGGWQLMGFSADETKYVSIAAYSNYVSGTYTEAELEGDYCFIYTDLVFDAAGELTSGNKFALISANLNVSYNDADSTITITGTFVGQNGADVPEFTLSLSGKVPAPEVSDMTFSFSQNAAGITVTPSNNDDEWDWLIVGKAVFDNYGADYIAEAIYEDYGNQYAVSGQQVLAWDEEISWYTTDEDTGELIPGEYVLVVWGSGSKAVTTPAAYYQFGVYAEGIENVDANATATKVIRNGQLIIEKNGVKYNAQGAAIK